MSVSIHCALAALLFLAGSNTQIQQTVRSTLEHVRVIEPYMTPGPGGGGSGDGSPLRASEGRLPRIAPRSFTPPLAVIHNFAPKLPMEPTLIASAELRVPQVDMLALGDPWGKNGPPSNGTGKGGGIGDGEGTGLGPGKGPGIGPGEGGDTGGGRLRGFTGASTAPVVLYQVEPEFSEEARKAKLQGVVMLYGEVDTNGRLRNIRVTRGLGLGLEEKAVEAVKQWRFRPGTRNGKPVVSAASIEVNFHLL
ncbi:MAG: energy transducer TonB [Bryobacteraceae bacterium]|jgi:TonB family protein